MMLGHIKSAFIAVTRYTLEDVGRFPTLYLYVLVANLESKPEAHGEPNNYSHSSSLELLVPDGSSRLAEECHAPDGTPAISECIFKDDALDAGSLTVHVYSNPGNCHLDFGYKGESFTAKSDKCGHENGGFEPFASDKTAVCYFDA